MGLRDRRKDALNSMMKEGIYEAAVAVLARLGLDGFTMDRVADEAGVAKGSLYNYFPSKNELLQFVYDRTLEPIQQEARQIIDQRRTALPTLEACLRAWFGHFQRHRGVFHFLFHDYAVRGFFHDREATARAMAVADMAEIMERGIAEGVFRPLDRKRASLLVVGMAREIVEQQIATDAPWPIDELVKDLLDVLLRGIGSPDGGKGIR